MNPTKRDEAKKDEAKVMPPLPKAPPKKKAEPAPFDGTAIGLSADGTRSGTNSGTNTGTNSKSIGGPSANSGIFDVSKMSTIRPPMTPSGQNVSHFTKVRLAAAAKKAQNIAGIFRGILIALAVPIAAIAAYFMLSGQTIDLAHFSFGPETPIANNPARLPAQTGQLLPPPVLPPPVLPPPTTAPADDRTGRDPSTQSTPAPVAMTSRPINLVLDSSGFMRSPYALGLNEDGDEVRRIEWDEVLAMRPPLASGLAGNPELIEQFVTPPEFIAKTNANQVSINDEERRKLSVLSFQNPELRSVVTPFESFSRSRIAIEPVILPTFKSSQPNEPMFQQGLLELRWLKSAALWSTFSGEQSAKSRMKQVLLKWAQAYNASGDPRIDAPLFDFMFAYDFIRKELHVDHRVLIDGFLTRILEAQYANLKTQKTYDLWHALHLRFATEIALITEKKSLLYYAIAQFNLHAKNHSLSNLDSIGPDQYQHLGHLLRAAAVLDRAELRLAQSGEPNYQLESVLNGFVQRATSDDRDALVDLLQQATYFRPDLLAKLASTKGSGRYGTLEAFVNITLRKPQSTLSASPRFPTSVPTTAPGNAPKSLPPKPPER